MLCGGFQEIVPPGYYGNHHDTPPQPYVLELGDFPVADQYEANPDRKLACAIRDELEKYNMIIGWNSKLFDIPFLNARLTYFGERPLKPQFNVDLMYYAGGQFNRLGSKKLENTQKFLKLPTPKTELDWETWQRAGKGCPKARKYVKEHNKADVKATAEAYWRYLPFIANIHR